jgi:D-alanine-D-alanine ligase
MKVVIIHNRVAPDAPLDEIDVIHEAEVVIEALKIMGHSYSVLQADLNIEQLRQDIVKEKPDIIFNLVEALGGSGRFCQAATSLYDFLKIPYTGARNNAMYLTINKLMEKEFFKINNIPTPRWYSRRSLDINKFVPGKYIVKPVWEHSSLFMNEKSIIDCKNANDLKKALDERLSHNLGEFFAEEYIDGREFNLALLYSPGEPQVLPHAEIDFVDYPPDKPRIVDYNAKWVDGTFEYLHTQRKYDFPKEDTDLLKKIGKIAKDCWSALGINGYCRVDFRINKKNQIYVLEVNTNPCISADAGYMFAANRGKITPKEVIERILQDAGFTA